MLNAADGAAAVLVTVKFLVTGEPMTEPPKFSGVGPTMSPPTAIPSPWSVTVRAPGVTGREAAGVQVSVRETAPAPMGRSRATMAHVDLAGRLAPWQVSETMVKPVVVPVLVNTPVA